MRDWRLGGRRAKNHGDALKMARIVVSSFRPRRHRAARSRVARVPYRCAARSQRLVGAGRTRSVPWHAVDTIRLVSTTSGGGPYQFRVHGWQFRDASGEPRADVSVTIGDRAEAVAGLEAILDHCRDAGWVPASARIERDVPQA